LILINVITLSRTVTTLIKINVITIKKLKFNLILIEKVQKYFFSEN
jgi:hypothetical protein